MVKVDACEFDRPVGGRWTLTAVNSEQRGMQFRAERDDAAVYVWREDQPLRRVRVPMHNVLWMVDAVEEPKKAGGK